MVAISASSGAETQWACKKVCMVMYTHFVDTTSD